MMLAGGCDNREPSYGRAFLAVPLSTRSSFKARQNIHNAEYQWRTTDVSCCTVDNALGCTPRPPQSDWSKERLRSRAVRCMHGLDRGSTGQFLSYSRDHEGR